MNAEVWACVLCTYSFEEVKQLAAHVELFHDEWLRGCRVPPRVLQVDPDLI